MLREELILGILSIFLFKIFPSKSELTDINFNEAQCTEIDEHTLYLFVKELIITMKGPLLTNEIY